MAVTIYEAPDKFAGVPPPEVKTLTPMGSLPILRDADGTVIGQSLAILEYIEDRVPEPDMRGNTPAERARVRPVLARTDISVSRGQAASPVSPQASRSFLVTIDGRNFTQAENPGDIPP